MKKYLLFLLVLILLTSCSYSEKDIKNVLDDVISNEINSSVIYRQDQNSIFYNYYLPSDVYKIYSSRDGAIMSFNGETILMNLNVSSIISSQKPDSQVKLEKDSFYSDDNLLYDSEGEYQERDETICAYRFEVYNLDGKCLVSFKTDVMIYYAYVSEDNLPLLTKRLFMIAKSMTVSMEDAILYYANVDMIDYTRKQVNLFETVIPKEGQLIDIIVDKE